MTEQRQFSEVFQGNAGGSMRATNTFTTAIAAAATPVAAGNTWTPAGDAQQVTVNAADLEAAHLSGGARSYGVTFTGRVGRTTGPNGSLSARVHLYLNGAAMVNPVFREVDIRKNDPASEFIMASSVTMVPTDKISIWLENVDTDDDLYLVEGATLTIAS